MALRFVRVKDLLFVLQKKLKIFTQAISQCLNLICQNLEVLWLLTLQGSAYKISAVNYNHYATEYVSLQIQIVDHQVT